MQLSDYGVLLRTANMADIAILEDFEQGVIAAERPFAANLREGRLAYYDLEALIGGDDSELILAEIAGQPVGCGYASIQSAKSFISHSQYAYLGFMYVVPAHRGKNIIGMIMEALLQWSRQRHVTAFKLDVYAGNQSAIRAYEKLGFSANLLEMWKASNR